MIRSRDAYGRYSKEYRKSSRWEIIIVLSIIGAYMLAMSVDTIIVYAQELTADPIVEVIEEVKPEPKTVRIKVSIDWTEERIKEEVWKSAKKYNTFPEKMWKVIGCESGYKIDVQSNHILSYGREQSYGLAQFHLPSGNKTAEGVVITKEMALDPEIALDAMAYHFSIGNAPLWTCYRDIYQ